MKNNLEQLARLIRYFILVSSTHAGSGHPTSSLSSTDLITTLMFGGFFRYDLKNPENPGNDRLIFSKGHASPLFYCIWAAAGGIPEKELLTLRQFGSRLEGHPSTAFPYTEVPTGSLGQGLSVGVGMAINSKYLDKLDYKTYVLLGDSEMAEGSNWEAMEIAAYYKLDNLVGILDVNRLGQRGQTLYGTNAQEFEKRISSFGWKTIVIDGHNLHQIKSAFEKARKIKDTPVMIIAKTIKGKGVKLWEDADNWHGKTLPQEKLEEALAEIGKVDVKLRGKILPPSLRASAKQSLNMNRIASSPSADAQDPRNDIGYELGEMVATRKAYGNALVRIYPKYPNIVVLDAEVGNSTYAEIFKNKYPDKFFEMFIAEQNMVGVGLGLAGRGKIAFVSTFAAFLTRAFDQIRMSQYAGQNIKFVGSHSGVSIGEDGPSQMALEDIAMFRSLLKSVVLYPSDAVSAEKLTEKAAKTSGIVYLRTTRKETPVIYKSGDKFPIGGSKTLKSSASDQLTVIGAGITLHEALYAYEILKEKGILIRVIDLYCVKPLDIKTLQKAITETKAIITVEDHYPAGGLGEAVSSALAGSGKPIIRLAVSKIPKSGKPEELLNYEGISASAIIKKVKQILK